METEYKVKSLAKAMGVLECFSDRRPELGVTEIALMLDLHKSTVHNIANTFEQMGYLSQNQETGKYSLGVKLLQFSYIINNHMGLEKFFLPFMKKIASRLSLIVYLGIPHGNEVLYIACAFPDENVGWRNILGEHAPMYCTGLGKAMLSFLPKDLQEKYVSLPLERFTEATITDKETLKKDLQLTRERGWSVDSMEHEYGVTCIGIPIFAHDGRVVAAVSISASSLLLRPEVLETSATTMREILEPAQHKL